MKVNGKKVVDTNAMIAYRAGVPEVCRLINESEIILVPAVVIGELLYGALNSQRVKENQDAVYKFLEHSLFIPLDKNITARYASIRYELKKTGRPLPENDIWIASVLCLCLQEMLILKIFKVCI